MMRAHTPPFTLPTDAAARKAIPLASGLIDYFPDALVAVASLSFVANEQHNPGEPLHWDRNKSTDHDDCLLRHFMARGTVDTDQVRHRTKVAWRALAALQEELETAQGEASLLKLMRRKAPWESNGPKTARRLDEASAIAVKQAAKVALAEMARESQKLGLYDEGIPAESAYIARLGPNSLPGAALIYQDDALREVLTAEELKGFGIGDVEPRDVANHATTVAISQHPANAETIRYHDERLNGPEDHL